MVDVVNNTKLHEPLMSASVMVQEEQVDMYEKVEEEGKSTSTNTKPDNQIIEDTTRLEQMVNDNTVRGGEEEQNEAPNVPGCEKEGGDAIDNDDKSVCTVQINELDDLLPKDRKSIDEALECERSLRLQMCLVLQ